MDRVRFVRILLGVCAVALLLSSADASAGTVTVGQLNQPTSATDCTGQTILETGVSGGPSYTVPVAGVITSWSFEDGSTPVSGLELKVGRPTGGSYTIIGQADAGTQSALTVNGPYPADIAVQPGDVIGIYSGSGDCLLATGNGTDGWVSKTGDVAPGTTFAPDTDGHGSKLPVSAQVQLTPGINLIAPSSGSVSGGSTVTIAGHDFTGASAVSFGSAPAARFVVDSDSEITAVSPASSHPGAVDVRVTTAAGETPVLAADQFTYLACVVPKLHHKKLKKVKEKLAGADCTLGSVKHHHKHHHKRVKKQSANPGTVLPPGTKINVKF